MKRIGILGNGWLGKKLTNKLLNDNYQVSVTNTGMHYELPEKVDSYVFKLPESINEKFFESIDVLVISLSPRIDDFIKAINILENQIQQNKNIEKVILWSSIGVYGNKTGYIDEDFPIHPIRPGAKLMAEAEEILKQSLDDKLYVLRLGGLVGEGRHPGNFFKDAKVIARSNDRINLVHADDVIAVTSKLVEDDFRYKVINVVAPYHPKKIDFYKTAIHHLIGEKVDGDAKGNSRVVNSLLLENSETYTFVHKDLSNWSIYE